jgi:predicted small secreted protein
MQRRTLIIVAILVVLALLAAGMSSMQGAGLERDVNNPEKVEAQPAWW